MDDTRQVGERITNLISLRFDTDVAFEKACGLPSKTVSNWRRGRSASYMKILPQISHLLGVDVKELLSGNVTEAVVMTKEEATLLDAFRRTREMSHGERAALLQTLLTMIRLTSGGDRK
jgi:transcriptional regulator with XRE-family HTH domain